MADDAEEIVVLTVQADTITDDWNWSAAYFSFWMRRFDAWLSALNTKAVICEYITMFVYISVRQGAP